MLSRVADSLFWMSRYIERAENNARIADVNLQLLLDLENTRDPDTQQQWNPIISSLEEKELFTSLYQNPDGQAAVDFVCLQRQNPNSVYACLAAARENARTVREQISSEMWEHINRLYLFIKGETGKKMLRLSPYEFFRRIITGSHLVQGVVDATMTHSEGWDFIRIGRFLERADNTSRILDVKYHLLLPSGEKVGGNIDTVQWMSVLKSCSALEAYRKIYVGQVAPWKVAEFLITHPEFPRSIRFSVESLDAALHRISGSPETNYANEAERLSGRLRYDLDFAAIGDIFEYGLHQYLTLTQKRLAEISSALFEIYCATNETISAPPILEGELREPGVASPSIFDAQRGENCRAFLRNADEKKRRPPRRTPYNWRIVDLPRPATAATVLSPLEIENAPVIYLAVKSWCFVFLACGIAAFSGCATDEEFNAAEASKTREAVPGEVNPNAPGASQQQVRTQPGFNF